MRQNQPPQSHPLTMAGSQSKVPSKLRDSSTASFIERDHSSSSRESSPAASISTPTSSVFSGQSSAFASGGAKEKKKGRPAAGTGPPKRLSPPRPPPPPIRPPEPDYHVGEFTCKVSISLALTRPIDVEGDHDETGSDTDPNSP